MEDDDALQNIKFKRVLKKKSKSLNSDGSSIADDPLEINESDQSDYNDKSERKKLRLDSNTVTPSTILGIKMEVVDHEVCF